MADSKYNLTLAISAVDKLSAPLRAMTVKLNQFTAPLKNLNTRFKSFGEAINFEGLKKGLGNFGGALKNVGSEVFSLGAKLFGIGVGAAVAFGAMLRGSVDAGDKLGEMADRVGLGVDVYASLAHAAAQADVDQEQFNGAMDQFNKRLGEAKANGGGLLEFLKKVSPKLADQVKNAKNSEAALSLMTDAFSRIEDPGKRAALAAAAFGKSGLAMGNFLHQGSAAIQEQQKRYLELAGSQEAFARGAGDLDNALRENEIAFTGLRNTAFAVLFPVFTKLSKILTDFLAKHRDGIKRWAEGAAAAIERWITGGGFDRLVENFGKVADGIGWVVDKLGPMGAAMAGVGVLALPLIASLGSLGVAAVSLAIEAIPLLVGAAGLLAPAFASVSAALGPALLAAAPFLAAAVGIGLAAKTIHDNWDELAWQFKDIWNSIKNAFAEGWEFVKGIVTKLGGPLKILSDPFGAAVNAAQLTVESASKPRFTPDFSSAPIGSAVQSEARVSVDFSNLPRGARVSTDPSSSQPVDLSAGYSMLAP